MCALHVAFGIAKMGAGIEEDVLRSINGIGAVVWNETPTIDSRRNC